MLNRLSAVVASLALVGISEGRAQGIEIRVDPGVELMAIVNRLAGRSEYNLTRVPRWAAAVDSHFAPFHDHPAVAMTRRLGFGYFIPMNLAVHLSPPPVLVERTPFPGATSLHRRWKTYPDSTAAYVELLRTFARDTRFAAFLDGNRMLVDTAAARLRRVAESIDRNWIERFWGGPASMNFVLIAGLTNGGASYGQEYVPVTGTPEAHAITGVVRVDVQGFPLYDAADLPTVLHEMNHPFVTPLIRTHATALAVFGDSLYKSVATQMRQQAYGTWDAMLNESLVRAAVPRYYLAHGDVARAELTIGEETGLGFTWTRALVDLLGEYERDRRTYPTMSDFMPRVIAFFREWAYRQ